VVAVFWRFGEGAGERVSGIGCGGALGAVARERWGSGALQPGHVDGEVVAAELGRDGVATGGGVQREGEWVQEVAECRVGRWVKQVVACGPPRRWPVPLSAGAL
jgi:hypothetical protein